MFSLRSTFSVAASTTKSAPTTPSLYQYTMILVIVSLYLGGDSSFVTILSKLAAMVAIPLSNDFLRNIN
jgi:hypothetical protein